MDLIALEENSVRMIRTRDLRGFDEQSGNARPVCDQAREERIKRYAQRIQTELTSVESN